MAYLNQFIENPGLQYVAEQIFVDLDPKNLSICRLISRSWKNFIDSKRCLIHLQVQQLLLKRKSIIAKMSSSDETWLIEDTDNISANITKMKNVGDVLKVLKFLRKSWIPLNQLNHSEDKINILNLAARENESNIVGILLDQCQNLRIKDYHGETPLHIACTFGHIDTIQLLLEDSVAREFMSLDSKCNSFNSTPLHGLCENGDRTALHAMEFILNFSVNNEIDINLNAEDHKSETPLHYICKYGNLNLLKLVFNHPATKNTINISAQNSVGKTLMHVACRYKQIEIVKFILDYSFENNIALDLVNAIDNDGWLLPNVGEPIVGDLLEIILNHPVAQNIKIEEEDIFGHTLWENACMHENIKALQVVLDFALKTDQDPGLNTEHGSDGKKMTFIVMHFKCRIQYKGCMEIAQLLLTHPISKKYLNMNVHLHVACYNGFDEVVKYLFDHCITNITTLQKEYDYETPIDILAIHGKTYLISKKS